jgi:hypothetical protein
MKIIKNTKTGKVKIKYGNLRISGKGKEIDQLVEYLHRTAKSWDSNLGKIRFHKNGSYTIHNKKLMITKLKHPMEDIKITND